ncbi:Cysteine/Histidine-rich C1 domain family protein [Gossypium australe]|uniref:Cysteine/Histidine-rich C1 domain family protein n=1 Tax=Gossypium australe TaxID=47621 RepID=A0A5B6VVH6_9ROSI|nr:Cysteine/Histidine-rich C1 domain family protein [Gossypium australe]
MEFQHFSHHHKLSFREAYEGDECAGCLDVINSPAYICEVDEFVMHKVCAEMPPQIQKVAFHPHPLNFNLLDIIVCDACRRFSANYIIYKCTYCEFNLDFKCAMAIINDENEIAKRDDEDLQRTTTTHFSHPHQLTRCKVSPTSELGERVFETFWQSSKLKCVACKQELQGTLSFICLPCQFLIHESCMNDMPVQVLSSPFHPHHILHPRPFFNAQKQVRCYACTKKVNGFSFYCNTCDVDFHVSCAKYRTRATKHSCHPHNLLQLGKSIIKGISCHACGRKNCNDSLFSCRKCAFNVHPKCIPLPSRFEHKRHLHPLTLVSPFAEDDSEDYYCDMCEIERNPEIHVYHCAECNYIAHIDCVLSEVLEPLEEMPLDPQRMEENFDNGSLRLEKKMLRVSFHPHPCKLCSFNLDSKCATSKDETPKERSTKTIVNHFSHLHQITRCKAGILESQLDFDLNCMACRQRICGIIYACTQCSEFFVHESCLKHMLMEVQSLFHPQHPLYKFPVKDPGERCKACGEYVEHLVFSCLQCGIFMHYSCAKYQFREIKHNCHADHHLLHLGKGFFGDESPLCTACGLACKDTLFNCLKCEFYIHLECIPLPSIVKHKRHLHPLVLTTLVTEDDSEEYYCDTCETQRNPEHDIYYCKECNYTSHIDCVLSEVEPPEEILQFLTPHSKEIKLKCVACKQEVQGTLSFIYLPFQFLIHESFMNDMPVQVLSSPFHPYHILHPRPFFNAQEQEESQWFQLLLQYMQCWLSRFMCQVSNSKCDFNVHPKCIPLPSSFEHKRHLHPLTLKSPFAEDDSRDYYCDMCETERSPEIHVYYCAECNYIAHIDCVLSEILSVSFHPHPLIRNDDYEEETIFLCDRCEELCIGSRYSCKLCLVNLDNKCATSKDETQKVRKVKIIVNHFRHPHLITRCEIGILQTELDFDLTCMACRQRLCGIIYACTSCSGFFVHEFCLKHIPKEVQSLFHPQHPLSIFPFSPELRPPCKACNEDVEGILFFCFACNFPMHYSCMR